jgi:hypothetical protein
LFKIFTIRINPVKSLFHNYLNENYFMQIHQLKYSQQFALAYLSLAALLNFTPCIWCNNAVLKFICPVPRGNRARICRKMPGNITVIPAIADLFSTICRFERCVLWHRTHILNNEHFFKQSCSFSWNILKTLIIHLCVTLLLIKKMFWTCEKSFSLLIVTYKIKSFFRENIILACTFIFLSTDLYWLFTIRQMELSSLTTVDVRIYRVAHEMSYHWLCT